jgi:hypothetical protein
MAGQHGCADAAHYQGLRSAAQCRYLAAACAMDRIKCRIIAGC